MAFFGPSGTCAAVKAGVSFGRFIRCYVWATSMSIGQPIQKENAGSARHLQWQVITGDTTKLQAEPMPNEPAPCSHAAFGYFVSYCSYVTAVLFIERLQIWVHRLAQSIRSIIITLGTYYSSILGSLGACLHVALKRRFCKKRTRTPSNHGFRLSGTG